MVPITCIKTQEDYSIPARTASASGLTRSALSSVTQGGSVKSTMCRVSGSQGGCVPWGIESVNVGSLREKDGEIVGRFV